MGLFGSIGKNLKQNWNDGGLMSSLNAAGAIAQGDYGTAAQIQGQRRKTLMERQQEMAEQQRAQLVDAAVRMGVPAGQANWLPANVLVGLVSRQYAPPPKSEFDPTIERAGYGLDSADVQQLYRENPTHKEHTATMASPPPQMVGKFAAGEHSLASGARNAPHADIASDLVQSSEDERGAMLPQQMGSIDIPASLGGVIRHTPEGRFPLESVARAPVPYDDREDSRRVYLSLKTARERLDRAARKLARQADERALLDRIAQGEGTDDATARANGYASGYDVTYGYGAYATPKKPLSQLTLGEVKALQQEMLNNQRNNKLRSSVVGRYQIKDDNLIRLMRRLGYNDKTVFSPAVQDRMGHELLVIRHLEDYQKGLIDAKQFQNELAREWASIEKHGTGRSHYGGQPVGTTSAEIQPLISNLRRRP